MREFFLAISLLSVFFNPVYGEPSSVYLDNMPIGYGLSKGMIADVDSLEVSNTFNTPVEIISEKGFCNIFEEDNNLLEVLHRLLYGYYRIFREKLNPSPTLVIQDMNTGGFWYLFWYPDGNVYGEKHLTLPSAEYRVIPSIGVALGKLIHSEERITLIRLNENYKCINNISDDPMLIFLAQQSLNKFTVIRYQNELGEYIYVFVGADGKIHKLSLLELEIRLAMYHEQQLDKLITREGFPAGGGDLKIRQLMVRTKEDSKKREKDNPNSTLRKAKWPRIKNKQGENIIDSPDKQYLSDSILLEKNVTLKEVICSISNEIKREISERLSELKKDPSKKKIATFFCDIYSLLKSGRGLEVSSAQSEFISWMRVSKEQLWVSISLLSNPEELEKHLKGLKKEERQQLILRVWDMGRFLTTNVNTFNELLKNLNEERDDPLDSALLLEAELTVRMMISSTDKTNIYTSPHSPVNKKSFQSFRQPASLSQATPECYQRSGSLSQVTPAGYQRSGSFSQATPECYQRSGSLSQATPECYQQLGPLSQTPFGYYQHPSSLSQSSFGHDLQPNSLSQSPLGHDLQPIQTSEDEMINHHYHSSAQTPKDGTINRHYHSPAQTPKDGTINRYYHSPAQTPKDGTINHHYHSPAQTPKDGMINPYAVVYKQSPPKTVKVSIKLAETTSIEVEGSPSKEFAEFIQTLTTLGNELDTHKKQTPTITASPEATCQSKPFLEQDGIPMPDSLTDSEKIEPLIPLEDLNLCTQTDTSFNSETEQTEEDYIMMTTPDDKK